MTSPRAIFVSLALSLAFGLNCGKSWGRFWEAISVSPTSGPIGTVVKLTAAGFDLATTTAVTFGGIEGIVLSKSSTAASILVMPGSLTGSINITNATGTATAAESFTVNRPGSITTQQGPKLLGSDAVGNAQQGISVALSADGLTALMGGPEDSGGHGAAWAFVRVGSIWSQQGPKLVGASSIAAPNVLQGGSVALSADGNTAILGGVADNSFQGAAWVFTRTGTTWVQQGTKLVGTGGSATARQGISVALSADGGTAIVGGYLDNTLQGAAWIFTRNGANWTQQGSKLVGTGATANAQQGTGVALSADGNTAIIGGPGDSSFQGAAWIFTRSGSTWTQQGTKLVGTGNVGAAQQANRVCISADGKTAMIGGVADNGNQGAAWVFTRAGTTWEQQGAKLVGSGGSIPARQGRGVALSADGSIALIGASDDNGNQGAAWVFTRTGTVWTEQSAKLVGAGNIGAAQQGKSVALSSDGMTAIIGGDQDNGLQGAAWAFGP